MSIFFSIHIFYSMIYFFSATSSTSMPNPGSFGISNRPFLCWMKGFVSTSLENENQIVTTTKNQSKDLIP